MNKLTNFFGKVPYAFYAHHNSQNKNIKPANVTKIIPVEIWVKILDYCTINTLVSLRAVNRFCYNLVQNRVVDRFYKQHSYGNHLAYSLNSYNISIKPQLLKLKKSSLVDKIDSYIERTNLKKNNEFSSFLFYNLRTSMRKIKKNKKTMHKIALPTTVRIFESSSCGNYWVTLEAASQLNIFNKYKFTLWKINITSELIQMQNSPPELNCLLYSMQFTHRNNLLTFDGINLTLWKLNNDTSTCQLEKLWQNKIPEYYLNRYFKLAVSENEKTFIFLGKDIKDTFLYLSDGTLFSNKLSNILRFKNNTNNPDYHLYSYYVSVNKLLTVLAIQYRYITNKIKIFCKKNNEDIFFEEEIILNKSNNSIIRIENSQNGVYFNSLGNICITSSEKEAINILRKVDNIWYEVNLDYNNNHSFCFANFMPQSHNYIFAIKRYEHSYKLEIINIDNLISEIVMDFYYCIKTTSLNHLKNKYPTLLSIKNAYPDISEEKDNTTYEIIVHPSWLSVVIFNKKSHKIWSTRKLTTLMTCTPL